MSESPVFALIRRDTEEQIMNYQEKAANAPSDSLRAWYLQQANELAAKPLPGSKTWREQQLAEAIARYS